MILIVIPGDFEGGGDVDVGDFGHLQLSLTSVGSLQNAPECLGARLDAPRGL